MLPRCMDSVAGQYFRDFQWVIVNDAGDSSAVEKTADEARRAGINVLVLHRTESTGMEAATNAGVRASQSKYIVLHDDDDTWRPDFLAQTIDVLDRRPEVEGVVTRSWRVLEKLVGGELRPIKSIHHHPVLNSIQIADMARSNLFPPIAFVYRRRMYELLGGYDERMSLLGDWDFNLRFLLHADIHVLREFLANYHVRVESRYLTGPLANSIMPGAAPQHAADATFRNKMIRRDIEDGRLGLGALLFLGRIANTSKSESRVRSSLSILKSFLWRWGV